VVRQGLERDGQALIAGGVVGQAGDDDLRLECQRGAFGDLDFLAAEQLGTAAGAAQAGSLVELFFVADAGVEVAALGLQLVVQGEAVAQGRVGFAVVVGLAVGGGSPRVRSTLASRSARMSL
jgi:hypothetical protein